MKPPITVDEALRQASGQGVARLDAQMLLLHGLGRAATDRAWLLANGTQALSTEQHHRFAQCVARRSAGEPLAYITGTKAFYGLTLQVDPRVLDPRDDTETLVDWALELLPAQEALRVVDLGTGSGAIALALKSQRAQWEVHAVDFSADALAVARANAQRLALELQFAQGSWMQACTGAFDAIVSNPPYIRDADPHLPALRHEPLQALTSGADGLDDLRSIIAQAPQHLKRGGWLLLEHGYDQAGAVRQLLVDGGWHQVQSRCDLAGIERCTGARAG